MLDDMGIFRTTVTIEHAARRGTMAQIADVMVDTGSELTWVPRALLESIGVEPEWAQRFRVADGRAIERDVGFAIVHCAGHAAPDIVVFGDPGDVVVLGARSLEGLNLRIDVVRKVLVDAGPIIAGASLPRTAA
jgi:predicted aspartyl protease